jgi:hypothetical protein
MDGSLRWNSVKMTTEINDPLAIAQWVLEHETYLTYHVQF